MAVNESDIELLHEYLDGEMPVAESEGLWRRLAVEQDLAAELDRLRADHALRTVAWSSFEPDEQAVVNLQSRVMRAVRREDVMMWAGRSVKIATTAAACILFGFTVGWMGHDKYVASHMVASVVKSAENGGTAKFIVDVPESNGRVNSLGPFNTYEEAQQFVADLARHQASRQETRDSQVVPAIDQY